MKQLHQIYVSTTSEYCAALQLLAQTAGWKIESPTLASGSILPWLVIDMWTNTASYSATAPESAQVLSVATYGEKPQKPHEIEFSYSPSSSIVTWADKNGYGQTGSLASFNARADKATVSQINLTARELTNIIIGTQFPSLILVAVTNNHLAALDVSANDGLMSLNCGSNWLTTLDVSKNKKLRTLQCYNNQLTSLDVSKNTDLSLFYCHDNYLSSLDVSKNTALQYLDCSGNKLTSLDITRLSNLTSLLAYNMPIVDIDTTNNTKLRYVDLGGNPMTQDGVDKLLTNLDKFGNLKGYAALYATNVPTVTDVIASLRSKGWHLELDGGM